MRTKKGRIANSANCGKFFCGLDVTNPEVLEHVRQKLTLVSKTWGFKYLKLDFIYSGILDGSVRHDYSVTKAQVGKSASHSCMGTENRRKRKKMTHSERD